MKRSLRPVAAAVSLAVLAAGVVDASPARAAASGTHFDPFTLLAPGSGCTASPAQTLRPAPSFSDNGYWVSDRYGFATVVRSSAGADDSRVSTSTSISARLTPMVGGPATFDAALSASGSVTPVGATPACVTLLNNGPTVAFDFTVSRPLWLTFTASARATGAAQLGASLWAADSETTVNLSHDGTGSSTVYLAPGTYDFQAEARLNVNGWQAGLRTGSVSGSVHAAWTPVGSAASAQSGRASRFVTFAGARDCGHGTLGAALSRRLRTKAKRVDLLVDGHRRVTLKRKRLATRSVTLTGLPATSRAVVTAVVTPKKGRRLTATRSYLACR
jgi:hypothetical protein